MTEPAANPLRFGRPAERARPELITSALPTDRGWAVAL